MRALQAILDRAATDPVFRRRLLVDPRGAILESFDVAIPETFRIKFVERDPDLDALIVLPDVDMRSARMSDDDFDIVSGGGSARDEWAERITEVSRHRGSHYERIRSNGGGS